MPQRRWDKPNRNVSIVHHLLQKQTLWPEFASELYQPSDRRLSVKFVPTFADRGCHVVSVTDPYGLILSFLDRHHLLHAKENNFLHFVLTLVCTFISFLPLSYIPWPSHFVYPRCHYVSCPFHQHRSGKHPSGHHITGIDIHKINCKGLFFTRASKLFLPCFIARVSALRSRNLTVL
jgi:hypothetical protein